YMRGAPSDPKGPLAHAIAYRSLSAKKRGGDVSLLRGALGDFALAKQLAQWQRNRDVIREATRAHADILLRLGYYTEAEEGWKPIYEQEGPSNADVVLGYGVASRRVGHLRVAESVLEQGAKKNPDNAAIRFELGLSQAALGECAEARHTLESLRNVPSFSAMI